MKPDSLIHLRVPAATKGRWVRASRAAGMRLTDWIVDAVEAHMQQQAAKVHLEGSLVAQDWNLEYHDQVLERVGPAAAGAVGVG